MRNIKELIGLGIDAHNRDAHNYYLEIHKPYIGKGDFLVCIFKHFIEFIKTLDEENKKVWVHPDLQATYKLGDYDF